MNKEKPFELPLTVRGYEMDAFQHVNNAVYVQYFEHARWMAFRELGPGWLGGEGESIVVRKLSVEYFAPAKVYDELLVRVWIEKVGRTSLTLHQDLRRADNDLVLATAEVIAVYLGSDGRPAEVPHSWRGLVELES